MAGDDRCDDRVCEPCSDAFGRRNHADVVGEVAEEDRCERLSEAGSFAYPRVIAFEAEGWGAGETERCTLGGACRGMTIAALSHFLAPDVARTGVFDERAECGDSKKDRKCNRDGDECPELRRRGLGGGVADG